MTPTVPIAAAPPSSAPGSAPSFAPLPAATPDQSLLPVPNVAFKAPDAISLPSVNFGQFGTDVNAASGAASKSVSDLINSQEAQKSGVFNQYQQAVSAFGNPSDIYNKLSNSYGIPLYQQQMSSLRQLLSHLSDDVTSRVQGSNLNDAQRDKLYQVEQTPLNQQLGDIGNYLGTATSNLTNQMDLYNKSEALALDPFKTYLSGLDATFGNQISGLKGSNDAGVQAVQAALSAQLEREKLAESAREADQTEARLRKSSNGQTGNYDLSGGSGGNNAPAKTDPMKQNAYNEVKSRVNGQSDLQLQSDYAATLKSANYGNARDKAKIDFYKSLRPDLFAPGKFNIFNAPGLQFDNSPGLRY